MILQGGYVLVQIPPELSFVGEPTCFDYSSAIEDSASCTFEKDDRKVTLIDAFKTQAYDSLSEPLELKISGIFTPRSVKPTTNFNITTFDSEGYEIDSHNTYFLPRLANAKNVTDVKAISAD